MLVGNLVPLAVATMSLSEVVGKESVKTMEV
jgi:hypothetical protein